MVVKNVGTACDGTADDVIRINVKISYCTSSIAFGFHHCTCQQ